MTKFNSLLMAGLIVWASVPAVAWGQDRTGLSTSVAVDLVGEFAADKESASADKMEPRSIDIMFYAPIDHLFDGTLSVAAHQEDGVHLVELHEAFLSSSRLIPGLKFKVGKYFLGIGRLNRFHQHEWPFISTPLVHQTFFDSEGLIDSGVELSYLLPLPFYLDLTVGVTNGFVYGHAHDAGEKPKKPTSYAHLKSFFALGGLDVQPGISFLNRVDSAGEAMRLVGMDLTAKVRSGKTLTYLWQSEVWRRQLKPKNGEEEASTGAYIYQSYGFGHGLEVGLRYDYLTVDSLEDALGESLSNSTSSWVPSLTYRPSEFSRFQLAYEWQTEAQQGEEDKQTKIIKFQSTFVLGAHPAHDF